MKPSFYLFIFYPLFPLTGYGQGCSDAGFCTINSLRPNTLIINNEKANSVRIGAFVGSADNNIKVWGSYLDYARSLSPSLDVDVRLTQIAQSGNSVSSNGISDVFGNLKIKLSEDLRLSAGVKIPLSDGDRRQNGLPLPMDYQSSLGTLDIILGMSYQIGDLGLSLGYQQPLSQNNNTFNPRLYPENSTFGSFQNTNNFQRAGDIMLRTYYPVQVNDRFTITTGILQIHHLANDKFTDENNFLKEIEGSKGLTLNANLHLDYTLSSTTILQFNIGVPLKVREVRPDGLTRGFIGTLEYRFLF